MIRVILVFVVLLAVWQLLRLSRREVSLEEEQAIGLEKAKAHIHNPILLELYSEARGIPEEQLNNLIEQGNLPSYRWRQHTYVENRELIKVNK